jgi:alkylation response protein AidB-like acyl-CoA dehydrogenase
VRYAGERKVFGKPLAVNQAVQWPLVELQTEAQMVRLLVYYEHIYRHHRRYRITEGAEEIQIRRVAQRLFGFGRR